MVTPVARVSLVLGRRGIVTTLDVTDEQIRLLVECPQQVREVALACTSVPNRRGIVRGRESIYGQPSS